MGVLADQMLEAGSTEKTYVLCPDNFSNGKVEKYAHRLQCHFLNLAERQGVSRPQIRSADVGISLSKVRNDNLRNGGFGVGYDFQLLVSAMSMSGVRYQSERVGWVVPLGGEDWFKAPNRFWRYRREQR
jgi:hypothetical protein